MNDEKPCHVPPENLLSRLHPNTPFVLQAFGLFDGVHLPQYCRPHENDGQTPPSGLDAFDIIDLPAKDSQFLRLLVSETAVRYQVVKKKMKYTPNPHPSGVEAVEPVKSLGIKADGHLAGELLRQFFQHPNGVMIVQRTPVNLPGGQVSIIPRSPDLKPKANGNLINKITLTPGFVQGGFNHGTVSFNLAPNQPPL